MKLAHISDTHLGYFAYGKTAHGRQNQRELDVCQSFQRCLDAILEREPDLVIHSGDLFHVVRPSNYSLIFAYRTLARFQAKRMGLPLVIIGGNHDTPQNAESTNILRLFEDIEGVHIQTDAAKVVETTAANVLCVPHKSLAARENVSWAPPTGGEHRVLVMHGLVDATKLDHFDFGLEEMRSEEWTYVALGDWHVHQTYGPNICYAGSTDFTSTNIWEEAARPKGWVWFDTNERKLEFIPVATRPVIDLPSIDATDLTGPELGEAMRANAIWRTDSLPIVRQRVRNVHQETRRELPIAVIREIEARALYYRMVLEAPSSAAITLQTTGQAASLELCWEKHIDAAPLSAAVDKARLKQLGVDLLKEVAEVEATPAEA